jgi:glycosyltransferase involved in cell wall biosynthesis
VTGPVPEAFLHDALSVVDVALNPMAAGSGTNLKMLEYAGAGVPVVSSAFGARGLGLTAGEHYVAAEPRELAEALEAVERERAAATRRAALAYDRVRTAFDWGTIAEDWMHHDLVARR